VDVREKILKILSKSLQPEYARLDDEDGITGFVVSQQFQGTSSLDRQFRLEQLWHEAALTPDERGKVLMIACLTPNEYEAAGVRVRIHRVRETDPGEVEVRLQGSSSDAEYVRNVFVKKRGLQTTVARPVRENTGVVQAFTVTGTEARPLTREKSLRILHEDPYIEVPANV